MGSGHLINLAYKKYGIENFSKEVISKFDSRESLMAAEREMVTEEVVKSKLFYNRAIGGGGGGFYGKTHTSEYKSLMSSVHSGKTVSEDSRRKMSESRKLLGSTGPRTEDVKRKIALKNSGTTHPKYDNRPVHAIDSNGNVRHFKSKFLASKELGVKGSSNISKALSNGKTAYGFTWYYTNPNN